ncbi:F-box/kelch-repeat protein At3g23880-like [Vicia villosa]|uniref:F-box/kelch-repeat protein At3g23880-like n=1 Tax=Vicia villosa TaxID=3911 RepID=UPI00273B2729|nr:F-box/kelch-repeat protein At3g23880-like [Vicia villosa]
MLFLAHVIDRCLYVSLRLFPIGGLLENPSIDIFKKDSKCQRMEWRYPHRVIGSCNELVCLLNSRTNEFYLRNPATTRPFSENLVSYPLTFQHQKFRFLFGYDNLTDKYKLVAFHYKEGVRIFTFGDNVWKNIQCFPVSYTIKNNGVYLSNSFNWFAVVDNKGFYNKNLKVEQLVIISLDLRTEKYTQFQFPRELDEVPSLVPIVCKLMDSLCFSHYTKDGSFVIWQMKEFGVEKSWNKLLKFDYHSLPDCFPNILNLSPLHVFENGDLLILATNVGKLIRYYRKDNRVVCNPAYNTNYLYFVIPHVESLVSTF